MSNKVLSTRVLLKVDTLENWSNSDLKLKKGELAFATVAATAGTGLTEPVVMVKIGTDDEKTFAELPWAFHAKASDVVAACKSEDTLKTFINNVIADSGVATGGAIQTLSDRTTAVETKSNANEAAINVLNGDAATAGSVAKAIADAIADLDVDFSVSAADASITIGGTDNAPTVAVKLSADADNALKLVTDGLKVVAPESAAYSIVKAADSGDYAAVYNLTKDGTIVGDTINIPKDLVVNSGSVVGNEIVLVLNDDANTEIKIPVASLIEYVTSGSQANDMVVINVSDDHKVTATITDGTITSVKLDTTLQTAIGKSHEHANSDVLNGIAAEDITAWDAKIESVTAAADSGIKATKTGNDVVIEFDDATTFIFDCGDSTT